MPRSRADLYENLFSELVAGNAPRCQAHDRNLSERSELGKAPCRRNVLAPPVLKVRQASQGSIPRGAVAPRGGRFSNNASSDWHPGTPPLYSYTWQGKQPGRQRNSLQPRRLCRKDSFFMEFFFDKPTMMRRNGSAPWINSAPACDVAGCSSTYPCQGPV